jgi:sRNA-binding carbon storage regulator CsrA
MEQILLETQDGTEVLITVTRIDKNQVRLHFEAPQEIKINRIKRNDIDPN